MRVECWREIVKWSSKTITKKKEKVEQLKEARGLHKKIFIEPAQISLHLNIKFSLLLEQAIDSMEYVIFLAAKDNVNAKHL